MADKGGEKPKIIIVKRVKKGHAGAHGGSWKVAYADFVTAMMALFLLLWLLSMVSEERRVVLSEFFKHYSVFEHGQGFMSGSKHALKESGLEMGKSKDIRVKGLQEVPADLLKKKLEKELEAALGETKEQVQIDVVEGGLRVQIVDMEGRPIFEEGSDKLTKRAKEILKMVTENIKDIPNRITVEGHTDSAPLSKDQSTNWELSTGRASSARRELEANGLDPSRFDRIVGYADTMPLFKENKNDPRNRRISLTIIPVVPTPPPPGSPVGISIVPTVPTAEPTPAPAPQERIAPIDKGKLIGDTGIPSRKPDFLKD